MKTIEITVAGNMTEKTYRSICDGFRRKFGVDSEFRKIVDDNIIGGFIADVNGEIFDLSIASQLTRMERHISG